MKRHIGCGIGLAPSNSRDTVGEGAYLPAPSPVTALPNPVAPRPPRSGTTGRHASVATGGCDDRWSACRDHRGVCDDFVVPAAQSVKLLAEDVAARAFPSSGKRKSRTPMLFVFLMLGGAAVGGFALSQWLMEHERSMQNALQQEMQAYRHPHPLRKPVEREPRRHACGDRSERAATDRPRRRRCRGHRRALQTATRGEYAGARRPHGHRCCSADIGAAGHAHAAGHDLYRSRRKPGHAVRDRSGRRNGDRGGIVHAGRRSRGGLGHRPGDTGRRDRAGPLL